MFVVYRGTMGIRIINILMYRLRSSKKKENYVVYRYRISKITKMYIYNICICKKMKKRVVIVEMIPIARSNNGEEREGKNRGRGLNCP